MHTLTADKQKRIRNPDAKPGQVFAYDKAENGTITLSAVKKVEAPLGKVRLVKRDGYTVGITDRIVSSETVRAIESAS